MHRVEKQNPHFIEWDDCGACVYIASLPINTNTESHNLRVNCIQGRVGPDMFGQADKVNRQTGITSCTYCTQPFGRLHRSNRTHPV